MLLLLLGGIAGPARAQQQDPLTARAETLVGLFNGTSQPETLFSPAFLAQVPSAQVKAITAQLRAQLGSARRLDRLERASANAGAVFLDFERGTLQLNLAIDPQPPHLIQGLLVVDSEVKGDSLARIIEELKALPGQTSLAVARLGDGTPAPLAGHEVGKAMAVGSVFKLFILAELDQSIRAGERKWSDVAALTHHSLPSGFLQQWPLGSPLTLQSLAALMISQSDNSATDTLLHLLGREKVDAMMAAVGVAAPGRNRPFLSTVEAFALKGGDPTLGEAWVAGGEAERRALLGRLADMPLDRIDIARLNTQPNLIGSVEWFFSGEDMVRMLDWLRRNGSKETLEIVAINPGIARPAAARFDYVGYKGGSESGVIAMSFLLRSKGGTWHAVSASWNNTAAKLDESRFVPLVARAVALLAD
jgi:beta-lactamase class A